MSEVSELESLILNINSHIPVTPDLLYTLSSFAKNTEFTKINYNSDKILGDPESFSFRAITAICEEIGKKFNIPNQDYYFTPQFKNLIEGKHDKIINYYPDLLKFFLHNRYLPVFYVE